MSIVLESTQQASQSLVPIDGLPDDVLCSIFLWNTTRNTRADILDVRKTLISTCLVCKRWQALIYHYPLLWSRVIDYERDTPMCINELLHRSGSTDIEVEAKFFHGRNNIRVEVFRSVLEVLSIVFKHSSRIVRLDLDINCILWKQIYPFLDQPAPRLQFLKINNSDPSVVCCMPTPLFANQAPFLAQLDMNRCFIDISSGSLYNLTELCIVDISVAPTVLDWMQVLQNMPKLRYLSLVNAFSHEICPGFTTRASLLNLLLLSVVSFFDQSSILLGHLDIPSSCGLRLICSKATQVSSPSNLLACLRRQLSHWPTESKGQFLRAGWLNGRVHFTNSLRHAGFARNIVEKEELKNHSLTCGGPLIWLMLHFDDNNFACRTFCQLLTLHQVTFSTTTQFEWISDSVSSDVMQVIGTLVNFNQFIALDTLTLTLPPLLRFLPHFRVGVLPSLRSLRLFGSSFEYHVVHSAVLAYLRQRIEVQAPMLELWIIDGVISSSKKEALEQLGNVKVLMARWDLDSQRVVPEEGDH